MYTQLLDATILFQVTFTRKGRRNRYILAVTIGVVIIILVAAVVVLAVLLVRKEGEGADSGDKEGQGKVRTPYGSTMSVRWPRLNELEIMHFYKQYL